MAVLFEATRGIAVLPLKSIARWGLLLNGIWEFAQCIFLYDMWQWGLWRGTIWMWGAIAGDVIIVLGVVVLSYFIAGADRLVPPSRYGWIALISTSVTASIILEWLAQYLELWGYSAWMPTLAVFGFEVGLAPIFQISLLPPLSVLFAFRSAANTKSTSRCCPHRERSSIDS